MGSLNRRMAGFLVEALKADRSEFPAPVANFGPIAGEARAASICARLRPSWIPPSSASS
jgi:hypothetical protein